MSFGPVPYSAGIFWPITPISTRWKGSLLYVPGVAQPTPRVVYWARSLAILWSPSVAPAPPSPAGGQQDLARVSTSVVVAPLDKIGLSGNHAIVQSPQRGNGKGDAVHVEWTTWPKSKKRLSTLLFLQFHREHIHLRHNDVDAIVALFNLVLPSDPTAFFATKMSSTALGFYETQSETWSSPRARPTRRIVLPPIVTATKCFRREVLKILLATSSVELSWSDLIHCG